MYQQRIKQKNKKNLDLLHNKIRDQNQVIESLKQLTVVGPQSEIDQGSFDYQLRHFLGKSLDTDIRHTLSDIKKSQIYGKVDPSVLETFDSQLTEPEKYNLKYKDKGVSTSDDFNTLLGAGDGSAERFIGEICFEIEFRILRHVFPTDFCLYGVSTRQIDAKIREASVNFVTLEPDFKKRLYYEKKRDEIFNHLKKVGYNPAYHTSLTECYIANFGHFDVSKMPNITLYANPLTRQLLKNIARLANFVEKNKTIENHKRAWVDVKCLINVLLEISNFDERPVFLWDERRQQHQTDITKSKAFGNLTSFYMGKGD